MSQVKTLENTSNDFNVVVPSKSLREFAAVLHCIELLEVFLDSQMLFRRTILKLTP